MKSKGLIETVSIAVVTLIMAGTVANVGIQNVSNVGELIQRESLGIMGERIESTIYALDSFEKAKVEMSFGGSKYSIYSEGGEKYIAYSYGGETNTHKLEEPYETSYIIEGEPDDEPVEKICVSKDRGISITPGGC